jgi:cyclophilin family peptidyl-prolyl cis-trans isomerase/predicted small lipoprotein YifL
MRVEGRMVALALACLVALAGCGEKEAGPTVIPTGDAAPTAVTDADADVASGCWTPEQRLAGGADYRQWSAPPTMVIDPAKNYTATVETSKGSFTIELRPEEASGTVNNFVCLARAGYYDGTVFHRVVPAFVIQGGDPSATGRGDAGYKFPDEPVVRDYQTGSVAMANSGPNTNGSQFFVVLEGGAARLEPLYNHFGQVTSGQEVVEAIGTTDPSVERVTIQRVTISDG